LRTQDGASYSPRPAPAPVTMQQQPPDYSNR
jgi:hypothetical protein